MQRFYSAMSIYGGTYVTFIAIEFSLYETVLREIETKCEGKSIIGYSLEHIKSLKLIHSAFVQTLESLMATIYTEEVDENNIVQKEHHYQPREQKKPKEKGIIDEFDFAES